MFTDLLGLLSALASIVALVLPYWLKKKTPEEVSQARVDAGDQAVQDMEARKLDAVRNFIKVKVGEKRDDS
jgi:hypothetical protein